MKRLTMSVPSLCSPTCTASLPGLKAILADVESRACPNVICLGDLVGYGPVSNEVPPLVAERAVRSRHGQLRSGRRLCDRRLRLRLQARRSSAPRAPPRLAWTDAVASERPAPSAHARRPLRGRTVAGELLAVHGSPRRINEYLFEDRPSRRWPYGRANPARGIVFGHSAHPLRSRGRRHAFVNVGSAAGPKTAIARR